MDLEVVLHIRRLFHSTIVTTVHIPNCPSHEGGCITQQERHDIRDLAWIGYALLSLPSDFNRGLCRLALHHGRGDDA